MLGLDMLDVAIGLIFVYLMLSFVASAAAELFEAMVKNRPRKLLEGMKELLRSDQLVKQLYEHPIVNALYQGDFDKDKTKDLPSYIPSRNFATTLLDLLPDTNAQAVTEFQQLQAKVNAFATKTEQLQALALRDPKAALAQAASGSDKRAVANAASLAARWANRKTAPLSLDDEKQWLELEVIAGKVHVQTALSSLLDHAGGEVAKAVTNIEDWYNSAMDRVSGWFKRRAHLILFVVGLFFAVALNVDSIFILRQLTVDKSMREALVASAKEAAKTPPAATAAAANADFRAAQERLNESLGKFKRLGLPIGWEEMDVPNAPAQRVPFFCLVLLGWLMTACAVSLGAPFWFDMLNKIIVVRSTVKPDEKSRTEASKDPTAK